MAFFSTWNTTCAFNQDLKHQSSDQDLKIGYETFLSASPLSRRSTRSALASVLKKLPARGQSKSTLISAQDALKVIIKMKLNSVDDLRAFKELTKFHRRVVGLIRDWI